MPVDRANSTGDGAHREIDARTFTLRYLGCSSLMPNKTGFGSVQGALRDLYLPFITRGDSQCRERSLVLRDNCLAMTSWNSETQRFHEDCYPYDSVTYVDYVKFGITKGKKRYFGYFRRYRDRCSVLPESILIPIERKHKFITKITHLPLIVCVLRRPRGVRFLDCHVLQADTELDARNFYNIVESRAHRQPRGLSSATSIDDLKFHDQVVDPRQRSKSQPRLSSDICVSPGPSGQAQSNFRIPLFRRRNPSSSSGQTSRWSTGASVSSDDTAAAAISISDDPMSSVKLQLSYGLTRAQSETNLLGGMSSYLIPIDVDEEPDVDSSTESHNGGPGRVSRLISKFESESPPTSPTHSKPVAMIKPSRRPSDSNRGLEYKLSDRNSPRRVKRITNSRKEQHSSAEEETKEALLRHTLRANVVKSEEIEGDVFEMNLARQKEFQTALGYLP